MKIKYKLAVALVAVATIGGVALQRLHAQEKPRAYVVIENIVTNQQAYTQAFLPIANIIANAGGTFMARGSTVLPIKGEPPKPSTVIEIVSFASVDKAQAAYFSPVWNDARKIGEVYSTARIYIVEGVPPK
jgi:uncharacterized protein (DUF1330 family)